MKATYGTVMENGIFKVTDKEAKRLVKRFEALRLRREKSIKEHKK